MLFFSGYDGLLEKHGGLDAVDASDSNKLMSYRRGSLSAIFHSYGYWNIPDRIFPVGILETSTTEKSRGVDPMDDAALTAAILDGLDPNAYSSAGSPTPSSPSDDDDNPNSEPGQKRSKK
ncbi:hypothetical protein F5Y19DRAFT_479067 [Xylariaceae sp. FL1651]|nr:hypothetical protein F5Y19DRAFT_479067 [Xylariaceae sp. FL1651]